MIYLLHADGTQTDLSSLKTREFVTVGSSSSCDLRLPAKGVAGLHCRVLNVRGWLYVQPVSSRHPVSVNGLPVAGREQRLHKGDKLTVGEWNMIYFEEAADVEDEGAAAAARPDIGENAGAREQLKRKVHEILLDRMDLKSLDTIGAAASLELRQRARKLIGEIIGELSAEAERQGVAADVLQKEVVHDVLGFGPLDDLINDPDITEIMCFGRNKIFVERKGRLAPSNRKFDSPGQLEAIIERIVGPLGRRIDESSPIVDARLPDGSRVNAVISPVAIDGASLDIRKFPAKPLTMEDLVGFKTLSPAMAAFLRIAVERRQNTVISGGTGSGKTTLLNIASSFIPHAERIVTIEDAAELRLDQEHVVRMEARPPNIEGKGEISIRTLVRNALRMRPDRIVVGECRGGEALDMLQAMNTGHDGSLTTVHANSPKDVMARLETLVLMSGMDLPVPAIRQQIGAAVNLVCQVSRLSDGSRKVMAIAEVLPMAGEGEIALQDIFEFRQSGYDAEGRVVGEFQPTGTIPNFIMRLRERGVDVDMGIFVVK